MGVEPGAFGLSIINGKVGKWVGWGQDIVERQSCIYTHAFLIIDNDEVVEAEPGRRGAIISPLSKYHRPDVLICDYPVSKAVVDYHLELLSAGNSPQKCEKLVAEYEEGLREHIADFGRSLRGTKYGYLDYLSLGLERFNLKVPWVEDRVRRQDRLICSQLVDFAYQMAGIHLFDDGRLPQDVTPGDLEHWVYKNAVSYF